MNYRKNSITEKEEMEIRDPRLLSVEYDAKTRKYIFSISYFQKGVQKIKTQEYRPLSKYLYDDPSKYDLKIEILHKYGLKAANNADLSLYVLLEQFDTNYNTSYASEYANGKFSPKLIYNFKKERKYHHMKFFDNVKLNRYVHELAEKQKNFAGAKIMKHRRWMLKAIAFATIAIAMSLFGKNSTKNSSTKAIKQVIREETKVSDENKIKKEVTLSESDEKNNNYDSVSNTTTSEAITEENQNDISNNESVNKPEEIVSNVIKEVTTLEELKENGYIESAENLGFGLGDKFSLEGQTLSKFPSSKFGKQIYISCDKLGYDYYKISEIVAYRQDEIIDRINLTTEEKYNIKTNELFGMYGPDIEITYNFYGYKGNKIDKDLGYVNLDKISFIDDKTKEMISENYKEAKQYTLSMKK